VRRWLPLLLGALVLQGCAEDPSFDDIPPPQPFDAQRFAGMEAGLFKSYLQLQDALAHDEFASAQAAAATLAGLADGDLTGPAEAAVAAADITALRVAFRELSEGVIARDRPEGLGVAYCPMAFDFEGARWLQPEGDLSNPYYGATMLRCGAFAEEDTSTTVGTDIAP
jgi:Cu(I)/Ag(I) efflux system membrane fusion protein